MPAPWLLRSSLSGSVSPLSSDAPSSTRAGCVAALAMRAPVAGCVETLAAPVVVGVTASTDGFVDGATPPSAVVGSDGCCGGAVCAVCCGWGFQLGFFWYM